MEPNYTLLKELFNRHYAYLKGVGVGMFKDEHLVADALQNVFLKLCLMTATAGWEAGKIANMKSYLYKSMHNECLSLLGQELNIESFDPNKHNDAVAELPQETDIDADVEEFEYTVIRKVELELITSYLKEHGALNEREDTLLKMKLEYHKQKDIAIELGITGDYVAVLWKRLKEKLQKIQKLATMRSEPA